MKVKECNDAKLAIILKKLPLISMQMGRAKVHGTVRDYLILSEDNIELDIELILYVHEGGKFTIKYIKLKKTD